MGLACARHPLLGLGLRDPHRTAVTTRCLGRHTPSGIRVQGLRRQRSSHPLSNDCAVPRRELLNDFETDSGFNCVASKSGDVGHRPCWTGVQMSMKGRVRVAERGLIKQHPGGLQVCSAATSKYCNVRRAVTAAIGRYRTSNTTKSTSVKLRQFSSAAS